MARVKADDNLAGKVGLGLGTVAITVGAVALGTALANKKNRTVLQRQAKKAVKGIRKVREAIDDGRSRMQVFAHRIGVTTKARRSSLKRGTRSAGRRGRAVRIAA